VTGPVIGIAGAGYDVPRFWGTLPVRGVPTSYVDAVAAAGGRPVILPPGHGVDVLDLVDGVVLAGGDNVGDDPDRDDAEIALVRAARGLALPMLGVCRGLQVQTVADGGTLIADLGEHLPHIRPGIGHPVTTAPGSLAAALLGNFPTVSSIHRQAADRIGSGWSVTARAEDDVVEAIEWVDSDWPALGVQWHPELDTTGPAVFGWLVRRAASRAAGLAPSFAGGAAR